MELDLSSYNLSESAKALIYAASQIDSSLLDPTGLIMDENAQLSSELANSNKLNSELVTQIKGLENELEQTKGDIHSQADSINQAKAKIASLRKKLDEAEGQINNLQSQLSNSSLTIKSKDAEIQKLRSSKEIDPESFYQFILKLVGDKNRSLFTQQKGQDKVIEINLAIPNQVAFDISIIRSAPDKWRVRNKGLYCWSPNGWVKSQ